MWQISEVVLVKEIFITYFKKTDCFVYRMLDMGLLKFLKNNTSTRGCFFGSQLNLIPSIYVPDDSLKLTLALVKLLHSILAAH